MSRSHGLWRGVGVAVCVVVLAVVVALSVAGASFLRAGISARRPPGPVESFVARRLRGLAIPTSASEVVNPFAAGAYDDGAAASHWADHCVVCHGVDGSGATKAGRSMYPPAPDMRAPATQGLSDGELYYIIRNGVRFTGMPAWGDDGAGEDLETWQLVRLIRDLPTMAPAQLEAIDRQTPSSAKRREGAKRELDFLLGGSASSAPSETQ